MKKMVVVLACSLIVWISCASNPAAKENSEYQKETGINLNFVKRGIFSMRPYPKNEVFENFFNKLMKNQVIFTVDAAQKEWALYESRDGCIYITTNDLYSKYNTSSKNALLTATVYAIGLSEINTEPATVEDEFYWLIAFYQENGVDTRDLVNDELYQKRMFTVKTAG
jgi:hypothetical protein